MSGTGDHNSTDDHDLPQEALDNLTSGPTLHAHLSHGSTTTSG